VEGKKDGFGAFVWIDGSRYEGGSVPLPTSNRTVFLLFPQY